MTQRNSKTVARSSKTLYREGGPGTLVGEGKGGRRFWGSQVCVASTVLIPSALGLRNRARSTGNLP